MILSVQPVWRSEFVVCWEPCHSPWWSSEDSILFRSRRPQQLHHTIQELLLNRLKDGTNQCQLTFTLHSTVTPSVKTFLCVIWIQVSVSFLNNTADENGAAIYATTLTICTRPSDLKEEEEEAILLYRNYYLFTAPGPSEFQFKYGFVQCMYLLHTVSCM